MGTGRASLPAALHRGLLAPAPPTRIVASAAALLLIAGIFYHGTQSQPLDPLAAPLAAFARLLLYFGLALLVSVALGARRFWLMLALCALVSGTDELAQLVGPASDVDAAGWWVDVAGASLAGLLLSGLRRAAQSSPLAIHADASPVR